CRSLKSRATAVPEKPKKITVSAVAARQLRNKRRCKNYPSEFSYLKTFGQFSAALMDEPPLCFRDYWNWTFWRPQACLVLSHSRHLPSPIDRRMATFAGASD
ncbi:hypothetical protein AVEN_82215-1, partial [Araneus ventricosus]